MDFLTKPKYDTIEQIRAVKWAGNHMADGKKMEAVDDYVVANRADRALCKEARDIVGREGMGVDEKITDAQLDEHLAMLDDYAAQRARRRRSS